MIRCEKAGRVAQASQRLQGQHCFFTSLRQTLWRQLCLVTSCQCGHLGIVDGTDLAKHHCLCQRCLVHANLPSTTRRVTGLVWDLFRRNLGSFVRMHHNASVSAKTHEITTLMSEKNSHDLSVLINDCLSLAGLLLFHGARPEVSFFVPCRARRDLGSLVRMHHYATVFLPRHTR